MTRFTALLLASLALSGCGKAPSTAAKIASTETERVVTYAPHAASAATTDKVGVYVDGRWYVKGEEPTAKTDIAIEAPASGMGNLHVTVSLAGVTDFTAHHFDPEKRSDPLAAVAGAPEDAPRVLLAHQPRSAPAAHEAGFDLQLSGHTHGGQFWPWMYFVPLQQPYVHGLHRLGRLAIYVSRGTGYWGPPKRFGAPSEITRLRLVPKVG